MTSRLFSAILRLIVRKERKKLLLTRLRYKEGICMEHLRSTELLRHRFFAFFALRNMTILFHLAETPVVITEKQVKTTTYIQLCLLKVNLKDRHRDHHRPGQELHPNFKL